MFPSTTPQLLLWLVPTLTSVPMAAMIVGSVSSKFSPLPLLSLPLPPVLTNQSHPFFSATSVIATLATLVLTAPKSPPSVSPTAWATGHVLTPPVSAIPASQDQSVLLVFKSVPTTAQNTESVVRAPASVKKVSKAWIVRTATSDA